MTTDKHQGLVDDIEFCDEEDDNWEYDRETRRAVRPSTPKPIASASRIAKMAAAIRNTPPAGAQPEDGSPS